MDLDIFWFVIPKEFRKMKKKMETCTFMKDTLMWFKDYRVSQH